MTLYNVINRSDLVGGQAEDVGDVLTNFDAIAAVINGQLDANNLKALANILFSQLNGFPNDGTKVAVADGTWGLPKNNVGTPDPTYYPAGDGTWRQLPPSSGTQLDYAQVTSTVSITTGANSVATAITVVSGNSITYDGSKVRIEAFAPMIGGVVGANNLVPGRSVLLRDGTEIGHFSSYGTSGGNTAIGIFHDTPPAGAHTYSWKAYSDGTNAYSFVAGAGGTALVPIFLRVTKA